MADPVLLGRRHFGKGLAVASGDKDGIVAKAAVAAHFIRDFAVHNAFDDSDPAVRKGNRDGADKAGVAIAAVLHQSQQLAAEVLRRGRIGKTRRADPGAAAESIDHQPGITGVADLAGVEFYRLNFLDRVGFKCLAVFFNPYPVTRYSSPF